VTPSIGSANIVCCQRLTEAIEEGRDAIPALVRKLEARDRERAALRGGLADAERSVARRVIDPERALAKIRTELRDWQTAIERKPHEARRDAARAALRAACRDPRGERQVALRGQEAVSVLVAGVISSCASTFNGDARRPPAIPPPRSGSRRRSRSNERAEHSFGTRIER
jgi:hypothetical protein